jgi:hypothetical protein
VAGLPTLAGDRSCCEPKEIVMTRIRRIAAVVVSLAAGLVTFAAPAFADVPHSDPGGPAPVAAAAARTVTLVTGGMPGWQIALIAIGAALLGATVAVLLYRARTTRRNVVAAAT